MKPLAKGLLTLLAVAVGLAVALLLTPEATPGPTAPSVAWNPDHLVVTLMPGETQQVLATATIRSDIPATSAEVVPALAPYVTATPNTLPALAAGAEQVFDLFVDVPLATDFQTIEGTLHLRAGAATSSRPLPITLNVWPLADAGVISIPYPPSLLQGGVVGDPITTVRGGGRLFVELPAAAAGFPLTGTFGILVHPNPEFLSLEAWFAVNVDPSGVLTAAGTFRLETFSDGRLILVGANPVPLEYDDEPLPYLYFPSPQGSQMASITLSDDHDLDLLGFPTKELQRGLLRTVAESIRFPE